METLKVITKCIIKKKMRVFYLPFLFLLTTTIISCNTNHLKNVANTQLEDYEGIPATVILEEEISYSENIDIDLDIAMELEEVVEESNTEEYDPVKDNIFMNAWSNPLSTFSIDVDHAAYSNVRRFITSNQMPPKGAVRIEEMINYFNYDYPKVEGDHPFELITELATCPWNRDNQLMHIGIQGKQLDYENIQPSNLTFLIDVSGSMAARNKLPLVKKSMKILLQQLSESDRVSIAVYAGAAGLALPPTSADQKGKIIEALDNLSAGGSTAGGQGIELAYKVAKENKIDGGNNRVILVTDGDFNVGRSSNSDMVDLIEQKRKEGIYLTICGFGMGNYKDSKMEQISNAGNGNYFYIDNIKEADKVFRKEMRANMFTIAKDVKIQIEFNPLKVKAYRLIGYENRIMDNEDFNNDQKDAGELGAGHTVTALYEIVPAGSDEKNNDSSLRYQKSKSTTVAKFDEMVNLKLRYKPLDSEESILINRQISETNSDPNTGSQNFGFSAAVAGFGMILRDSPYKGSITYDQVLAMARDTSDPQDQDRQEFIRMVEVASLLAADED